MAGLSRRGFLGMPLLGLSGAEGSSHGPTAVYLVLCRNGRCPADYQVSSLERVSERQLVVADVREPWPVTDTSLPEGQNLVRSMALLAERDGRTRLVAFWTLRFLLPSRCSAVGYLEYPPGSFLHFSFEDDLIFRVRSES